MPYEDKMTIDERRKYLRRMKKRYDEADRKGKGELLDEMERYTGLHRQSLVRLMNGALRRKPRCGERSRTYGPEVDDALRIIAKSRDDICAERLQPTLAKMAKHLAKHGELEVTPELLDQLGRISVSTVRRSLSHSRQDQRRLPQRAGRKPNKVLQQVPMVRIPWDEQEPGHFEVDLVHHSGPTTSGEYVCSLQMIDVAIGWSERAAVLGRSYVVMQDAFQYLVTHIPFPVLEVHPDNDSAFFNQHMFRFWGDKVAGARLSRSRPYHKNDNRFVEQKNSTLIRAYLGDVRLDTVAQTWALNHLYERMWRYYNFFQPVMRLKEKVVIPGTDGQPARVKKKYDEAHTPFERRLQTYPRLDLLVLDDFGLKTLRPPAPEDFYDVINGRYERGSILLTSNRPPEEWPELFGNPLLASAGLDRLTHGAHAVIITGSSFRAQGPQRWEEVHIEPSAST